jgi:EmrB/QacA subfamily drug resistance transporter
MVVLDVTVVNVALPSIGADLGFAPGDLQWVVTAYVLFTGGLMLLGGRAADLLGRRPVFLAGLTVFTAASLTSGLASDPTMLIVSRAVQGVGAAMLVPAALSIVTTAYTGHARTRALAVWGAIGAAGGAAGVLFGGILTTVLSWEWIFFINAPIGVATAVAAYRLVPPAAGRAGSRRGFDLAGAVAVMTGLFTLIYAIDGAAEHGWTATRTLALFGISAVALTAFALIERAGSDPLVPPRIWRVRSLTTNGSLMLVGTGLVVGTFFLNSVYLQHSLGFTALETGLAFLPETVVILVAAHAASHLLERFGTRVIAGAGFALVALGSVALALAPDQASYWVDILPGFLAWGAGSGLLFVSIQVGAMSGIDHHEAGLASGVMTTAHELGGAIGVAVLSAVATSAATASDFAPGFEAGYVVAAAVALAAGLLSAIAAPSVKPAPGQHVAMH